MICPHGNIEGSCPVCFVAKQTRPPIDFPEEVPLKMPAPAPALSLRFVPKEIGDNIRNSGVLAFKFAPQSLTRDNATMGLLGGSVDLFSERLAKSSRELPQMADLKEITRLKIPQKEIRKTL